jgi:hypothetical protein
MASAPARPITFFNEEFAHVHGSWEKDYFEIIARGILELKGLNAWA